MKITKQELKELGASQSCLARFIRQTNGTEDAVEVSSLVGGHNNVSDFLWIAGKTLSKRKIVRFACDCALLNLEILRPYTNDYNLIHDFLVAPYGADAAARSAAYAAYAAYEAAYDVDAAAYDVDAAAYVDYEAAYVAYSAAYRAYKAYRDDFRVAYKAYKAYRDDLRVAYVAYRVAYVAYQEAHRAAHTACEGTEVNELIVKLFSDAE